MSLYISVNKHQALSIEQQLQLLALPKNKRVRLLKTVGRTQKKKARDRIRRQTDTEGQPFEPRKGKGGKVLKRLAKSLEPYVTNGNTLSLRHKNRLTGGIAARHQLGKAERMTARRMEKIHGRADYSQSASRQQAKALLAEGYKVRRGKGKGYRRPSIKDVVATMSQGQAAIILQQLRGKPKQQSWQIPVPPRPFLGDTTANVRQQLVEILEQMRK